MYSYAPDEDRMVKDPKLAEHLAHWGINIMALEKTEKTMAELELELNKTHEFFAITEQVVFTLLPAHPFTARSDRAPSCYLLVALVSLAW